MTRPTGAAAGERRLCRSCLLEEIPRTYQDTPKALPVYYRVVQQVPAAQHRPGGQWVGCSAPPALMASSDESYREESNKCKEAGGVQDNLFNEEEDNKDIGKEKDDDWDKEASNAELITASAEERTQQQPM
jgi:hypothetical protein